jgi:hypothetical protein
VNIYDSSRHSLASVLMLYISVCLNAWCRCTRPKHVAFVDDSIKNVCCIWLRIPDFFNMSKHNKRNFNKIIIFKFGNNALAHLSASTSIRSQQAGFGQNRYWKTNQSRWRVVQAHSRSRQFTERRKPYLLTVKIISAVFPTLFLFTEETLK